MVSERRKILFLQKRLLFPTDSGGKIRTLNVLRHLAKWHDITYLCNVLENERPYLGEMTDLGLQMDTIPWREVSRQSPRFYMDLAVNLLSRYPFNVNKDYDSRLRQRAAELIASESFDLVVCDFVQMARNCLGLSGPPQLLFEHNVEAQIFQRHAQNDEGWLRRKFMALQWKKMHRFESQAGAQFDRVVAVSEQDRTIYENDYGWEHVDVIDTAVDTEFFTPQIDDEIQGRCVFVGSMDWLPNQDGTKHFVRNIWPLVLKEHPSATFQIVGRNPPDFVRELGNEPGVEVTGSVPDIRPHMAEAEVVVVPLLVGGGTRLKIFEGMAMQKATVSTPLGAEGLKVTHENDILLSESPETFASSVNRLLSDADLRKRLAANSLDLVTTKFSAEAIARQFDGICQKVIRDHQEQ